MLKFGLRLERKPGIIAFQKNAFSEAVYAGAVPQKKYHG